MWVLGDVGLGGVGPPLGLGGVELGGDGLPVEFGVGPE